MGSSGLAPLAFLCADSQSMEKHLRITSPATSAILGWFLGWIGLLIVGLYAYAGIAFVLGVLVSFLLVASPTLGTLLLVWLIQSAISAALGYYGVVKSQGGGAMPRLSSRDSEPSVGMVDIVGDYVAAFNSIGYTVLERARCNPDAVMSVALDLPRSGELVSLDSIGSKVAASVAFGVTDDRLYCSYLFVSPQRGSATQVSGVFVGRGVANMRVVDSGGLVVDGFLPRFHVTGRSAGELVSEFPPAVRSFLVDRPSGSGSFWVQGGWLLTEVVTATPTVELASAGWEFLSGLLDAFGESGVVSAADGVFPDALAGLFPQVL